MQSTAKKIIRVLNGDAFDVPPVWLMRQAGRYLPEYKETRKQAGSFLDLCYSPELAEEVTLQPIRRYDFDAAILFADILLVPQALGLDLWFVEGEGPRLSPADSEERVKTLKRIEDIDETLSPVYETVSRLRKSLPQNVALIGFAGAPWTVATYMVAGRGTPDQGPARSMMYENPAVFDQLIDRVTEATIHYLTKQVEAGAEVLKLFDSWAGALPPEAFEKYAIRPAKRIFAELKEKHPDVPLIGFPRGAGINYLSYREEAQADCIAVDHFTSMSEMRSLLGDKLPLQGNLDPLLLVNAGAALEDAVRLRLEQMKGTPFVFNLGHGITPNVPPEHVSELLSYIRGS